MTIVRIVWLALITSALASVAQTTKPNLQAADNKEHLQFISSARIPFEGTVFSKFRCDDSRNVYALLVARDASAQVRNAPPVTKLTPNAKIAGTFTVTDHYPNLRVLDFFVTGDGRVFQAAYSDTEGRDYVVLPSAKAVQLESDSFLPYQIVVFTTGDFLLSGIRGADKMRPYTAVFNSAGKLITSIYEAEDAELKQKTEDSKTHVAFSNAPQYGNSFVTSGDAVLGSDGNAYLLRAGDPALIYVISNKGEVLRKLKVAAPSPGLVAERLKASSGNLAVIFLERDMNRGFSIITDDRGRVLSSIEGDDLRMLPGLLACYKNHDFTFIGFDDDGNPQINRAELK